ncbi:MAG: amino acid adenylation domain-containing protein, partial [Pyrinomonadaceae bacterium]
MEYERESCIHHLFERQAARTPEALAVICGDETLTYGELDARSNRLAHRLVGCGVGTGSLVALCLDRSADLLVSVLAVLKAGAAYVPLDPQYPRERLSITLSDAGACVVLTQSRWLSSLPTHAAQTLCLDTDRECWMAESEAALSSDVTTSDLAYVIYTSGSTGRPKGVAIEHRNAVTFLHWACETFSKEELSRVLAATSICFDLSVFEMFAPLSCGGAVVLAENALALAEVAAASAVTLVNTVPSAMAELVRAGRLPDTVRVVNLAGEALARELVETVYERGAGVRAVYNLYGPTEDTTYTSYVEVKRGERRVTIGRGIANTQLYVLDSRLEPVPVGVTGELYIGGEGLARGYVNRPEQTAERFIPNPFTPSAGARLYRTGDRVRWVGSGEIEYLGRADSQVKVRGFRIELGEVESGLRSHERVREAVVVVREEAGEKRLVGYVIGEVSGSELRRHLKDRVPEYMIPTAFVVLEQMPLTPNGKVDRKGLPAPDASRAGVDDAYVAPRSPVEEIVADIWCEVLKVERVGVHDNFFELGGHSLKATQLTSRLRHLFGVEMPLRAVFADPTVAAMARYVEGARAAGHSDQSAPLVARSGGGTTPASYGQRRMWLLDQMGAVGQSYQLTWAVRLRGRLDEGALERSLSEIVRRHESLRTTFNVVEAEPVQIIAAAMNVPLPVTDLSLLAVEEREEEARRLLSEEARLPFNLEQGPVLRASLLRLSEDEHILMLVMHHIVSDGWSNSILSREFSALYEAYLEGRESPLEELSIQYADYAVWQREGLQGEVLAGHLSYWREKLEGVAVLELPTDHPRPAVQSASGASCTLRLSGELSAGLRELARREGATLFMVLLAGWQALLSRYSGQEDICVGTPIAGRGRRELEGLIGFFVNTLVMRAKVDEAESFRELVGQVREASLGAYAHQELPFEKLVEELQPERDASRNPLFDVLFAMQGEAAELPRLRGLEVMSEEVGRETAKFDLSLSMAEESGVLKATLQYSRELYEAETIGRMLGHFERLLSGAVSEPERGVGELEVMGEEERRLLLVEWNET